MGEGELLQRFRELQQALRDRDELELRLHGHPDDARVRELSLAACERVLARRASLYRALIRDGWTPPEPVVRHLLEDEVLLAEPLGGAGG